MPLSSKLQAEYAEFINSQLDNIPTNNPGDFILVIEALENILSPQDIYTAPDYLRERLASINDYINSPEAYVQNAQDYPEYQEIIINAIRRKIAEFSVFSDEQKLAYIQEQQQRRDTAAAGQAIMSSREAPQPGSDRHVLPEQQWLEEMQGAHISHGEHGFFSRNERRPHIPEGARVLEDGTIETRQMSIERVVNLSNGLIIAAQLENIHNDAISSLLFPGCMDAFRENVLTLNDLAQLGGDAFFKLTAECIGALRERLFSVTDIYDKNVNFVHALTRAPCLDALRARRTTIALLIDMSADDLYQANRTGEYPNPPRPVV
jgi:hypothetical protein